MSEAGIDEPEQACPSTNLICGLTILLATATACFGSQASSSITILIFRPLTPPASLMAAAAVSAPRFICSPMLATGPVIGPATAMVSSPSARAGRAPRPNESAASETTSVVFILAFSREGSLAVRRGRRAELCARIGQVGNAFARRRVMRDGILARRVDGGPQDAARGAVKALVLPLYERCS